MLIHTSNIRLDHVICVAYWDRMWSEVLPTRRYHDGRATSRNKTRWFCVEQTV